jgi:putative endopeptidase
VGLETRLATGHWDNVATRDVIAAYNLRRFDDLSGFAPNLDWAAWVAGLAAPARAFSDVVVRQPSFLSCLSEALESVSLSDWKSWLTWRTLHSAAPYLSSDFVEEHFAFYEGVLRGTGRTKDRWKERRSGQHALGEAVGRSTSRATSPEAKAQIDIIVRQLTRHFGRASRTRLAGSTPDPGLGKLRQSTQRLVPRDMARLFSLRIDAAEPMENVRRSVFPIRPAIATAGRPVDCSEWLMNVQLVNAIQRWP